MSFIDKLLRIDERRLKKIERIANQVLSYEDEMKKLTDEELKNKTPYFKELLQNGKGDLAIVDQQVYSRILITVLSVVESVAHRAIQYCVNGWTLPDDNTNLPEGEKIMLMKAVLEIFTQRNLMIWHLHDFLNSQEIVIIWIVSNICIVFLLPVFA